MKTFIIYGIAAIIAILSTTIPSKSQEIKPWTVRRAYVNLSGATNGSAAFQFNLHFNNSWTGFLAFDQGTPTSKNLPTDYERGSTVFLGMEFDNSMPFDAYSLVTFGMGKVLTKPSDKAWITATAGISIGHYDEEQFTRQPVESFYFFIIGGTTSNYQTTTEKKSMVGITPGIEGHVNLFRFMAVSSGAKAIISNTGFYPTFNVGMDIGLMRPNRKNMIKNS